MDLITYLNFKEASFLIKKTQQTNGRCGLCHEFKVLEYSHLLPKSLYKRIRRLNPNNDLIAIRENENGDKVYELSNHQIKARFLCKECESLFNRNGENTVLRESKISKEKFHFLNKLKENKPIQVTSETVDYDGSAIKNIDLESYFYFACSIIWRMSEWPQKKYSNGSLGKKYSEQFRQYLLGHRSKPDKTHLVMVVQDGSNDHMQLFDLPVSQRLDDAYAYDFIIPGLKFSVIVGGSSFDHLGSNKTLICLGDVVKSAFFKNKVQIILKHKPALNVQSKYPGI